MQAYDIEYSDWTKEWIAERAGTKEQQKVMAHIKYMSLGNFGDTRQISGSLYEKRVKTHAGYRIYYYLKLKNLVRIIGIGNKNTQKRDIIRAIDIWQKENRKKI